MKRWYAITARRNCEAKASAEVVRHGFEAFVPVMQRPKRTGLKFELATVPRYAPYLFGRFDVRADPWGSLLHDGSARQRPIVKILSDAQGNPSPVPDEAMAAMRAYEPPVEEIAAPRVFAKGQSLTVYLAPGVPMPGIFVGYEHGKPCVRVWIFGREQTTPVSLDAIEAQAVNECGV
jgi:hypothetical protein